MTIEITETIFTSMKSTIESKIKRFSNRAIKFNLSPLEVVFSETYYKDVVDQHGRKHKSSMCDVTITMVDEIKIEGDWILTTTLEATENGVIVNKFIHGVPSIDTPEFINCDHCHTNHVRKYGYVVFNQKTGEILVLGKACLEKYFPASEQIKQALFSASFLPTFKEYYDDREKCGVVTHYNLEDIIALAINDINSYGYHKSDAECPTSRSVSNVMMEYFHTYNEEFTTTIKKYSAEAIEIIENFKNIDPKNDYLHNLKIIAKNEAVNIHKHMGYAVSMIPTYRKMVKAFKTTTKTNLNEHFGNIKERYELELTLDYIHSFEGSYGLTYVYNMKDVDGRVFVWFTGIDINKANGDSFECVATIKDHGEYKDTKQTTVTRLKMK